MKKSVLVSLVLLFTLLSQAQVSKSVTSTSGGLAAAIGTDISTVTNLTITGTIDATDFVTMYNMPLLAVLDLSAVTIDAYTGDNGPLGRGQTYLSNAIPATAFKMNKTGKTSLTTVILPATLTSVGNLAFGNCSGLTSITIPSGVTTIGGQAIDGCTN